MKLKLQAYGTKNPIWLSAIDFLYCLFYLYGAFAVSGGCDINGTIFRIILSNLCITALRYHLGKAALNYNSYLSEK
jgi:hypothetical protein